MKREDPGGLAIALLLLAIVAACSFLSWQQYIHYADQTRRTNQALSLLDDVVSSVQLAESSQRGYLLTSDTLYLAGYKNAVTETNSELAGLDAIGPEIRDSTLSSKLRSAVQEKTKELAATMTLAQAHRFADAEQIVQTNRGFYAMLRIRSVERQYREKLQATLRNFREDSRFYARTSQWVSVLGSAGIFLIVFFGNRRIVKLVSTTADLNTELTHVNGELQQFVYSASHDLREPLRTMIIYSQLVQRKLHQGLPIQTDLDHVAASARLMSQIVEDLMTYTQMGKDALRGNEQTDMRAVVKAVRELLLTSIDETKAELRCGELSMFPLSEIHARILLQNLIGNALKYRKLTEAPQVKIETRHSDSGCQLSVSDNGIGIKGEYQEQIFGLFKRLHSRSEYPGTGLGLAICKKIVERYGGTIEVRSELDVGSTFTVIIPDRSRPN